MAPKTKAKTASGTKTKAIMPKVTTTLITVGGREFTNAELEVIIQGINDKPKATSVAASDPVKAISAYDQCVMQVEEQMKGFEQQLNGLLSDVAPVFRSPLEDVVAEAGESGVCCYGDSPVNQHLYRVAAALERLQGVVRTARQLVEL